MCDRNKKFYQSTAAQQDHEYNECLKVVVLYNGETSSSEVKPDFSPALGCVYVQERTATVTLWNIYTQNKCSVWINQWNQSTHRIWQSVYDWSKQQTTCSSASWPAIHISISSVCVYMYTYCHCSNSQVCLYHHHHHRLPPFGFQEVAVQCCRLMTHHPKQTLHN